MQDHRARNFVLRTPNKLFNEQLDVARTLLEQIMLNQGQIPSNYDVRFMSNDEVRTMVGDNEPDVRRQVPKDRFIAFVGVYLGGSIPHAATVSAGSMSNIKSVMNCPGPGYWFTGELVPLWKPDDDIWLYTNSPSVLPIFAIAEPTGTTIIWASLV